MPYICLARNDIPDGTLQVLDLWPNTSQRNQSIDPPGQTRYINRVLNDNLLIDTTAGVSTVANLRVVNGLQAYIADRVAPGGTQAATETVQILAGCAAGDEVVLGGVTFTAVAGGAVPANQEFNDVANSGSAINTAASLALALTDAATDAALLASPTGGSTVSANTGGTDTVTVIAATAGPEGAMPLTENTGGARIALGDASGHLDRAHEEWTTTQIAAASAALIARLDAGLSLTEADINTAINGVAGVSGVDVVHPSGSSTVLEILSILAGRGYRLPVGAQFASAEGRWESALAPVGSFTDAVSVFDTQMLNGEFRPANPFLKLPNNESTTSQNNRVQGTPGSTQNVEYKGVRYNVDGDPMQVSLQSGALSRMQDGSVSLFVDNIYSAFKGDANGYADFSQPGPQTAQVNNARLVTVYDDDGSLL